MTNIAVTPVVSGHGDRWPESVARSGGPNGPPSFATGAPTRLAAPTARDQRPRRALGQRGRPGGARQRGRLGGRQSSLAWPLPPRTAGGLDASLSLNFSRGHQIPRRRTHDGTVRSGESVPAHALQVLSFALREPARVSTNVRNCPDSVDRERSQTALHAAPFLPPRELRERLCWLLRPSGHARTVRSARHRALRRLPVVVMQATKNRNDADRVRRAVFESRRTNRDPLLQPLMRPHGIEVGDVLAKCGLEDESRG
jgi:hypothetical protein